MKTENRIQNRSLLTYVMLLLCCLLSHIGFAQISGHVKDEAGKPIESALVCHANDKNTWAKTDKNGAFSLPGNDNTKLRIAALHCETIKSQTIGSGTITMSTDALIQKENDVYHISFDHLRPGSSYTEKELKDDFEVGSGKGFFNEKKIHDRAAVDYNESVDPGGVSIRATFPKKGVKTEFSGFDTRIPLGKTFKNNDFKSEDLYLSYWVKFADNFPFDKCGGKLPSLGGSDYNSRKNTWKGRIMWRRGGSIQFYMELPGDGFNATDDSRFWGDKVKEGSGICDFEYEPYLASPGWHNIELHYKFESAGKNNGLFEGWVDGVNYDVQDAKVFNNYRPANRKDITINAILLSTFFGGGDNEDYWPPEETYAWFDEFRVSKTRINEYSKYNGGPNPSPTNNAPTVGITAPDNGTRFETNDTFIIRADASDSDGRIAKVEFYNGTTKLGEDSSAPYSLKVDDLKSGTYVLTAKATDNDGRSTTSSSRSITVGKNTTPEPEPNPNPNPSPDPDPATCSFGTPTSGNLPSFNRSKFTTITVLGKGPNLDNISQLLINWNSSKKGLYQFAIKTKNGNPSYYLDLRKMISQNFGDSKPSVTINKSGVNGLDGDYWVAKDATNLVLVSKSGDFSIYCSTGKAPNCDKGAKSVSKTDNTTIHITPNPASSVVRLSGLSEKGQQILIYNTNGQLLLTQSIHEQTETNLIDVKKLSNGLYFVKVINREGSTSKALKLLVQH